MKKVLRYSLLSIGSVIGMILIGFLLLVGFIMYAFNDYYSSSPRPNFTGYESSISLNEASVETVESGYSTTGGIFQSRYPTYTQTYASGATLTQSKMPETMEPITCKNEQPTNYPPEEYSYDCTEAKIKDSGEYAVIESYRVGELERVWATARIGGTIMYVYIPETIHKEFIGYEGWQEYFEAMQPIDLTPPTMIERIIKFLYPQL